ncbi:hypothetical protein [Sphingomonas sp. MA1305]|uniref:hypothetical protein n=1 Tax=Sphingomonas sp. MA1305 TaxID=2479204 RepID=UPI0018DF2619|nr:hypothetical protein [Sphingomonas sp. MA1305]
MAKGDRVGADQEVVRYARPSDFDEGVLSGSAFDRNAKDYDGVSVCRLGVFSANLDEDLDSIRAVLGAWRSLKKNGRLAQISVQDIEAVGSEVRQVLVVVEDEIASAEDKPANPAHALIEGLPFIGGAAADLASDLLRRKVSALHEAVLDAQR